MAYTGNSNERCTLARSAAEAYFTFTDDAANAQSHYLVRAFPQ